MSTNPGFDRLRPRTERSVRVSAEFLPDAQGKRALFSSSSEAATPAVGSVLVECSGCESRTVLGLNQALRSAIPSLHFGFRVGHGDAVRQFSVFKHAYPTYLRCPACGRMSWVRLTLQV
ncbi:MAG TPA: hypothetical protein VME70_00345 [Mycobacteriales bacterium]|nr:hypothetical protein [Mycobacteriales bacterium]